MYVVQIALVYRDEVIADPFWEGFLTDGDPIFPEVGVFATQADALTVLDSFLAAPSIDPNNCPLLGWPGDEPSKRVVVTKGEVFQLVSVVAKTRV